MCKTQILFWKALKMIYGSVELNEHIGFDEHTNGLCATNISTFEKPNKNCNMYLFLYLIIECTMGFLWPGLLKSSRYIICCYTDVRLIISVS